MTSADLQLGYSLPHDLSQPSAFDASWEQTLERLPVPAAVVIGLFIFATLTMGDNKVLYLVPYGMGIMSALLLAVLYARLSPTIPAPVYLYFGFLVWAGVGALLSRFTEIALLGMRTHLQFAVMFGIFATMCQDTRSMRLVTAFIALGALANVVAAAMQGWTGKGERVVGLLHNPNGTAIVFCIAIIVAWSAVAVTAGTVRKAFFVGLIVLFHYALIRTGSRGGALACAGAELYMLWLYRKYISHRPQALAFFVTAGIVCGIAIPTWLMQSTLGQRFTAAVETVRGASAASREGSTTARLHMKLVAMEQAITHPIFGLGRGNFWPTGLVTGGWDNSAHDSYLNTLVETGMPGFLLYYSIHLWIWRRAGRFRNTGWITDRERHLCTLVRVFILFALIIDLFDESTYRDKTTWAFMAMSAGLLQGISVRIEQRIATVAEAAPEPAPPALARTAVAY